MSPLLILVLVTLSQGLPQKPNLDAILNRRTDVYIAGFFPFGKGVENSNTGRGVMPSVKLALDHVNEHDSVLRNYRLHMWWNDTECNAAVGVKSFFDMMHSGPHKLMLFGAACTHVTDPIAKASKHWHLTQLSYADTHPMFTKEAFPNFFRIVPSENAFNLPRIRLLQHFNWTRVGTIYQNEPRYALAHNRLLEMYGRAYTWLLLGTYSNKWWMRHAPCSKKNLTAALDTTILTDLLPLSTTGETTVSGITAKDYQVEYDRRRGLEYSRFHGYTYDGIWAMALAIQTVAQRVRSKYKEKTVQDFKYRDKEWEQLFLDALSNVTFEGVTVSIPLTGPVRFYDNERKASILLKQFQGEGTGEVKVGEYCAERDHLDLVSGEPFKWFGKNPPKDRTLRLIEHTQVNITIYSILVSCSVLGILLATGFLAMNIHYRNQRYIKMSSPHLNNLIIVGCMLTYLSVIFLGLDSSLSSIGTLIGIGLYNIHAHSTRMTLARSSTTLLCHLISSLPLVLRSFSGHAARSFVLMNYYYFITIFDSTAAFPYICTARAWLLMAGFSLAFGAMFSKTWRVHSIFTDVKLNKRLVIKDYQLFMVVGVLLAIDLAIMTTLASLGSFLQGNEADGSLCKSLFYYIFVCIVIFFYNFHLCFQPHPSSEDIVIVQENEYCQSERMTIFIGVIYAYKGLLLVFGAFLAWETRHVSIPALNDSQHIGLSVYNVLIMCIMGAAITLVLQDHKDALFVLIAIFIIFCTTGTLCLVFVPKLLELRRNGPGGAGTGRIRATLRPASTHECRSPGPELERRMKELRQYNNRYRRTLQAKENELQMLLSKLGSDASSESSTTRDSRSPAPSRTRLPVPKENISHPETSDITSVCSLSASAGAEAEYINLQNQQNIEKTKPSAPPEPLKDPPPKEPKKEQTKNVSFKNHLDYTSPPSSKAVPEKDQLAKLPYGGWSAEEPSEPPKSMKVPEPARAEAKTIPALKTSDTPTVKSMPAKVQEPMYTKAATKVNKTPELQKKVVKTQDSLSTKTTPSRDHKPPPRGHRRMSSVSQAALLTDLMHVSVDQDDLEPPPGMERKVIESPCLLEKVGKNPFISTCSTFPGQRRDSEKRKKEFIVVQSDLWDTNTFQYTCQKSPPAGESATGTGTSTRGGTPEGYREAETLRMTDRLSKRRGSEFPQPVSTPPQQAPAKRRQSAAHVSQILSRRENGKRRRTKVKTESTPRRHDDIPRKSVPEPVLETETWKPDPDTIRMVKTQDSPAKRLRQEAEPLKRAKGVGDSPRLTQASHTPRPDHHKSSPNVASRHKTDSPSKREDRKSTGYRSDSKRQESVDQRKMYTASSESELFECAILPIFHKLLTERHKSQPHGLNLSYGVSCPNISIKCDIVEYL
ncbi:hypothetical protein HF086_017588 [Spodoptera exigua]|uniref:G-protein coupled receptors family 3 profile domain-containing protein n=1 Tax=Spodoptera exigua TaxID=7107 RepID=A0A922MIF5_SPOEX|nr:hypothetical protein HF086_017588 [Spodoptera exigua]